MAASAGAWYRVGKVNVTNDNQSVVGVDTNWQSDVIAIAIGDIFTLDAKTWYEVIAVNNDTSITLDRGFEGSTGANKTYAIVRNTSGTILTRIAGQVSVQFNQKQLFLDELRTWLNSNNATEELTDSHGLKQSLKTPSQMVRDHDEKLAELDAINPYPYAMRKVEFEARRAANNAKFAASGFVHFGRHNSDTDSVGEGLSTRPLTGSQNTFYLGRENSTTRGGTSKTNTPSIHVAGVITTLLQTNSDNLGGVYSCPVKLPPAEDGTRTYDSETGISVTHATPAIAFASETATNKVVTDRIDMWGFEAFLREINDADPFVYSKGLIQSLAPDINGVATVSDNVRPTTYFAWYEGDEDSRGKGVNWQMATEAQRIDIASDPDNNIYFDDATGKFYQWCIRGRSFAGAGNGEWEGLDVTREGANHVLHHGVKSLINAQGVSDSAGITAGWTSDTYFTPNALANDSRYKSTGAYSVREVSSSAHNSQCYFLVCGTVNRLNQGAYHPSFNPSGTRAFVRSDGANSAIWNGIGTNDSLPKGLLISPTERSSCFIYPTMEYPFSDGVAYGTGGSLNTSHRGRPDGRAYDAIYASGQGGVCRDMRYSAWGLTSRDFYAQDRLLKSGEFRGSEAITNPYVPSVYMQASSSAFYTSSPSLRLTRDLEAGEEVYVKLNRIQDTETTIPERINDLETKWVRALVVDNPLRLLVASNGTDDVFANQSQIASGNSKNVILDFLFLGGLGEPSGGHMASSYLKLDVIGDPNLVMAIPDLANGWSGSLCDGTPDGVRNTFPLTAPVITQKGVSYRGVGDSTWGYSATLSNLVNFYGVQNTINHALPEGYVYVINYTTLAKVLKPTVHATSYGGLAGIGDVYTSCYSNLKHGGMFAYSASGVINNSSASGDTASVYSMPLKTVQDRGYNGGGMFQANDSIGVFSHDEVNVRSNSLNVGAKAIKALSYQSEENQQGYLYYAYTELEYDGNDWGDDGKIHLVDSRQSMLDTNGNTVKVGTARSVEPLGWIKNDK